MIFTAEGLSLSYGDKVILKDITFGLEARDKMGIVGVNGCGKSTLLSLIYGDREATSGQTYVQKGAKMGMLRQDGAFDLSNGSQTLLERMMSAFPHLQELEKRLEKEPENAQLYTEYKSAGGLEYKGRCASLLQKLGFADNQQTVATLSGGQKTRLALAVELAREPDILLLDEPTNHLDIQTLTWLENYLQNYKKCLMVVSHDRYFLDRVTNKTLSIERTQAKLYKGNYSESREQRRIDREIALHHWENQQKEIAHQEAYIAQQRQWNRERNIIAAESRLKLLNKMEKVERPMEEVRGIHMRFRDALPSGNDVMTVYDLSHQFGDRKLFSHVSFLLQKGDRACIIGENGCGKSTFLRIALGLLKPTAGHVEMGYHVKIGYYDQENQNLTGTNTVLEELWSQYPTKKETEMRNILAWFRFVGDDVFKQVAMLSGGERARLTLAKLVLAEQNLLILDEPTNHLDMDSREELEEALEAFQGTILLVTHDRYLMEKLATRILEFHSKIPHQGDLSDYHIDHVGKGYTEYTDYRDRRLAELGTVNETKAETVSAGKDAYLQKKARESQERKLKNQLEKAKKQAEELEKRIEEIDAELFGEASTDYVKAAALDKEKTEAEEKLLELYEFIENNP